MTLNMSGILVPLLNEWALWGTTAVSVVEKENSKVDPTTCQSVDSYWVFMRWSVCYLMSWLSEANNLDSWVARFPGGKTWPCPWQDKIPLKDNAPTMHFHPAWCQWVLACLQCAEAGPLYEGTQPWNQATFWFIKNLEWIIRTEPITPLYLWLIDHLIQLLNITYEETESVW